MATTENILSSNKRIAKNTLMLYFRMFIMLGIALYTSRVVLATLGVEDYGIYNIVGGIVSFFVFINTSLLTATQRFINFAIGNNNIIETQKTFSMCITTHLLIAVFILILAETIGLYLLHNYIKIPESRITAAHIVYQFSILTCCLNIIRTPYNANIIAYERMSFYAYLSIVEAVLKLLIVYFLLLSDFDKLILYAILIAVVAAIINIFYIRYCHKFIDGSRYIFFWNRDYYKEYIQFSAWSLFGSGANVGVQQGLNILINLFSGVVANAAYGIANQVSSAVYAFVSNFQLAFNPQLIQSYASNSRERFLQLIYQTSKFSYYLLFIISLPVIICMPTLLSVWLKEVPEYTVTFCRWTLIFLLIDALSAPLWVSVQAIGNIKKYQIIISVFILLNLPISFLLLKMGCTIVILFIMRAVINLITLGVRVAYLSRRNILTIRDYIVYVFLKVVYVTFLSILPLLLLFGPMEDKQLLLGIISFSCAVICIFFVGINRAERNSILLMIKSRF